MRFSKVSKAVALLLLANLMILPLALGCEEISPSIDRSPVDLVLSTDESWLATVNQTSNSVSLIRAGDGKILDEVFVGLNPSAIIPHPDEKHLLVTSSYSGDLHWLRVEGAKLLIVARLKLGFQPTGIAISPDGKKVYVALTDADQIAEVDFETQELLRSIKVGRWPRYLAVSNNGKRLAVGTSGDRGISIVDSVEGKLLHIDQFVGLNIGHMQTSKATDEVFFPWMVYRRNPINEGNIRLGWVMASRLGKIGFGDNAHREAISLDPPGEAIADPHGLALSRDEQKIVISASGTHELLILKRDGLPFMDRGSTDHIDQDLLRSNDRFYRIALGGRPMGLRISRDDTKVYVANYLDSSVQVVDLVERKIVRTFFLGGSKAPSLARHGEAIFFDAKRSLDQWYSCHSCHYLGGTNAVSMDTMNDGSAYTFKTVLPLYEINKTGPWTWHGWQKGLGDAMKHSLRTTMIGPKPSQEDADAVAEYLSNLRSPPNPYRGPEGELNEDARRGKAIFEGRKGACIDCHRGETYCNEEIHDFGLGATGDAYKGYNTPSLLGVFRKVELLHDGRASTLLEVLQGDHAPEKVHGEKLSEQETLELIEYLKTL
jgi:DNA-binding beta-propeller fold protein YncE